MNHRRLPTQTAAAIGGLLLLLFTSGDLVASQQAAAQQDPLKRPVVYTLPGMDGASVKRDITYKTVNGAALKMDAYYPAGMKSDARLPVVIFVNGVGDPPAERPKVKEWGQYTCWAKLIAASGFIAINYETRTADPNADSQDLIEYVRKNAASLKVDENDICLWSCSANVRVGLPLVMQAERKYIRCAVIYYGAAAVPSMRNDVPILIARAGRDMPQLNAGIDNFVRAGLSEDVPVTLVNYVNGQHAFDLMDDTDESREVIKQTISFIKFHLSQKEAPYATAGPLTGGRFIALINNQSLQKALQEFDAAKKANPGDVLFRENSVNLIGYQLLQAQKPKAAIEVLKLNVAAYPNSANVYDSLADAYEADGNRELAVQNAEKALEKLSSDSNLNEQARNAIRDSANGKLSRLKQQR
jgi:tetratricopeptide (TPR) repeat protein